MPGWNCSTEHVREFSELPVNAQAYVRKIEELTAVPSEYRTYLIYKQLHHNINSEPVID